MKNPLNKRIVREFKDDIGKYLVIFLFTIMLIGAVSGFLISDNSVYHAYKEGFEKYKLEWGHFTLSEEPTSDFLDELSEKGNVNLYNLNYFEEDEEKNGATLRVYSLRDEVNTECVMEGSLPSKDNEIALDRVYAQNSELEPGDTITLKGKKLVISGLIAVPDYSSLFESNTDMMFDSINFSIAVMTKDGYHDLGSSNQFYNYAWTYHDEPKDDAAEKKLSDDLLESLKEVLISSAGTMTITDYVPRYDNQAIQFTGEDMGGDKAMITLFNYIVIVILAFVFAVSISNTISKEAGVIGTLRASGFSRRELICHYMILPVLVTLIAAVIGNIIGYTFMKNYMASLYYNSYSLCTYKTLWNMDAFLNTTIVPVILMFVINLAVLIRKLRLSPLDFLRRDLSKKKRKKALWLNTKIPFFQRFRLRILLQNIPNYLTLFVGIVFAAFILVFGLMMKPLMKDYADRVSESMISTYQYVLAQPQETENEQAEKYCMTSLDTTDDRYMIDAITIYGVDGESRYISKSIPEGKVLVSDSILKKFGLAIGDTLTLKDKYSKETYSFVIAGGYSYDAALSVFMPREDYLKTFDKEDDYYTGYFSNEKLSDISEDAVAAIITKDDLTKLARQMLVSMGDNMMIFNVFGIIMFLLLMYLLSKQIIEKNTQSISMTKILGFTDGEIGRLYIVTTSVVTTISLLLAIPIISYLMYLAFTSYLYTQMTGYIPCNISKNCYLSMFLMGLASYALVALLQIVKIKKISKSESLKNVE